jgi:hypothetical protein
MAVLLNIMLTIISNAVSIEGHDWYFIYKDPLLSINNMCCKNNRNGWQ